MTAQRAGRRWEGDAVTIILLAIPMFCCLLAIDSISAVGISRR